MAKLSYAMKQIERVIKLAKSGHYGPGRKPQAIHLWSRPGEGKTASIIGLCKQQGIPVRVVALANHDPTDLKGLGWVDENGNTRWSRPADIIPTKEEVDKHGAFLILWDDIVTAPPGLQALTYDALDRWFLGPHEIDPRVVQVTTGNRATDRAFVNPMPSALGNRILQMTVENTAEDWLNFAMSQPEPVNPLIGAWVARFGEGALRNEPRQDQGWLSPRSLWNMDRYHHAVAALEQRPIVFEEEIVRGFIGPEAAQSFMTYAQHQKLLDLVEDIPKGKLGWDKLSKLSIDEQYIIAIAAIQKCNADEFCPWVLQWQSSKDVAAFAVKQFSKSKPDQKVRMTRYMPQMHKQFGTMIAGVFNALK